MNKVGKFAIGYIAFNVVCAFMADRFLREYGLTYLDGLRIMACGPRDEEEATKVWRAGVGVIVSGSGLGGIKSRFKAAFISHFVNLMNNSCSNHGYCFGNRMFSKTFLQVVA